MEIRNMRISARITPTLYKQTVKVAKKRRWSVSDMVEEALTMEVQQDFMAASPSKFKES